MHEFVLYQAGFAYEGAIREGDLVLVIDRNNQATELYDLSTDLAQEHDLIDNPRLQDTIARLREKFLKHNDRDDSTFDEPRTAAPYRVAAANP